MKIDTFGFESAKEAFHDGIVVAIAFAAHTYGDAMLEKKGLVIMGGVLAAAIRMEKQSSLGLTLGKRHVQGIVDKGAIAASAHGPADNAP